MNITESSNKDEIISSGVEAIDSLQSENQTLTTERNILFGVTSLILIWNLIF